MLLLMSHQLLLCQTLELLINTTQEFSNIIDATIYHENIFLLNSREQPAVNVYNLEGKYIRGIELVSSNYVSPRFRRIEVMDNKIFVLNRQQLEVYNLSGTAIWDTSFSFYPNDVISSRDTIFLVGLLDDDIIFHTIDLVDNKITNSFGKYPVDDIEKSVKKLPLVAETDGLDFIINSLNGFGLLQLHDNRFIEFVRLDTLRYIPSFIENVAGRGRYYARPSGINGIAISNEYIVFSTYTVSPDDRLYYIVIYDRQSNRIYSLNKYDMMYIVTSIYDDNLVYLIGGDNNIYLLRIS